MYICALNQYQNIMKAYSNLLRLCILCLFAAFSVSCGHDEEPIKDSEPPSIEETTDDAYDEEEQEPTDDSGEDDTGVEDDPIVDYTTYVPVAFIAKVDDSFYMNEYDALTRCVMEIYSDGKKVAEETNVYLSSFRVFTMTTNLDSSKQYKCLLWVDNGTDSYDTSNGLRSINMGSKPSLAFYATLDFNTDVKKYEVALKPAVAKVELESSTVAADGTGSLGVSALTPINYVFDVYDGTAKNANMQIFPSADFTITNTNGATELAHFYTFAPNDAANVDLDIEYNKHSITIENVPIQTSRTTELVCDMSNMDFNIKIYEMGTDGVNIEL